MTDKISKQLVEEILQELIGERIEIPDLSTEEKKIEFIKFLKFKMTPEQQAKIAFSNFLYEISEGKLIPVSESPEEEKKFEDQCRQIIEEMKKALPKRGLKPRKKRRFKKLRNSSY